MNDATLLPFQTAFDPPQLAEGSLDPLGLYSVADALGVRLAPGVRERQRTPRFLTLALVGHWICQGMDEDQNPDVPPAWLVFEWLVVASLVQQLEGSDDIKGIPGREKVKEALRRDSRVCTTNYLKTPSVFGFHGVYRVLGVKAGLFDDSGRILSAGRDVLQAWRRDQHLEGDETGYVAKVRGLVEQGQRRKAVGAPPKAVKEWIATHLNPYRPGRREKGALWNVLVETDQLRGQYATMLVSDQGQHEWLAAGGSEARYHASLSDRAYSEMRNLLNGIQRFESLARTLVDAFDEARARMTSEAGAVDSAWLARGECMRALAKDGGALFKDAFRALEDEQGARDRLERQFGWLAELTSASECAAMLVRHHERIQRNKPPGGKRPWIDLMGNGRMAVRPQFQVEDFASRTDQYVHTYRTVPIWQFATDLGRVPKARNP